MSDPAAAPATRAGFVAIAGRPNVGKSTLVNAIVGRKVSIVSDRPQTTRRAVRGVASGPDWQLVLVDLPGNQRPRDALTSRMQRRVESEVADADAVLVVCNADEGVGGAGDQYVAQAAQAVGTPVLAAVNKLDRVARGKTMAALAAASELLPGAEIFPISARTGAGVGTLVEALTGLLPASPFFYDAQDSSDQADEILLAELVREQILNRTHQEVPHSVEVEISEIEREQEITVIRATVWTETESQKGILIGKHGRMVKAIGTAARKGLQAQLGGPVHLDLSVRVRRAWRGDDALLDRLGIE